MRSTLLTLAFLALAVPTLGHGYHNSDDGSFACPAGEYQLGDSRQCAPCSDHCIYCSSAEQFDTCQEGYQMTNNHCSQSEAAFTLWVVGAAISMLGFIVCGCCLCCRICRSDSAKTHANSRRRSSYDGFSVATGDFPSLDVIHPCEFEENWAEQDLSQAKVEECAFCLDPEVNVRLSCGHLYHIACIGRWLGKHTECPLCKRTVQGRAKKYCQGCFRSEMEFEARQMARVAEMPGKCKECRELVEAVVD